MSKAQILYEWAKIYLEEMEDYEYLLEDYKKLVEFGSMIMKNDVKEEMMDYWKSQKVCEDIFKKEEKVKKMEEFKKLYGFFPNNKDEKKKFIDNMLFDDGIYPKNDDERNDYMEGMEMSEMMRMDWE